MLAFARPDRYRTRRLAIELSQAATRHPEVARALRRFHATSRAALAEVLSAGQRDGRIDAAADPDALARTILLLIMGLTHIDALDDRLAADEAWRESLRSDVRHLLGRAERRRARPVDGDRNGTETDRQSYDCHVPSSGT